MGRALGRVFLRPEADLLVPVPLHKGSTRAFNQSLAVAEGISKEWGIPARECLVWRAQRETQTSLGLEERKKMPCDAFSPLPKTLAGRRVVLVDDVATTGATFQRAANAVARGGAAPILALSWTYASRTKERSRAVR